MSGMDRLPDSILEDTIQHATAPLYAAMARELLAHRRASQAAPAPVAWRWRDDVHQAWNHINWEPKHMDYVFVEPLYAAPAPEDQFVTTLPQEAFDAFAKACEDAPAPSDGLREALEPFAKAADIKLCGEWRDDQSISRTDVAFSITFGDLRRARAALTPEPAQEGGE